MKKSLLAVMAALLAAGVLNVSANPDAVKVEFEKKYPGIAADKVTKAGFGELWEIYSGGEILYTDEKVTYLLLGTLVNAANKENITEKRLAKLTAINFNDIPTQNAIKLVRGNGSRKLAIFEDPNCGYCKRFERDLNTIDNITAYIFPYPILSPDSTEKAKSIWCASNKLQAWQDLMLRDKAPATNTKCDNPIEAIVAYGQKQRIQGTPVTIFENGERASGALPKEQLEARIVAAGAKPVAVK
ncbi:MAG: DsbC family protein [Betaproteobacteria bacterium]|nr:DsbC family protein [Betaproteobacteria bacterium]